MAEPAIFNPRREPATGQTLHFEVANDVALDAFYHPLVHLQTAAAA